MVIFKNTFILMTDDSDVSKYLFVCIVFQYCHYKLSKINSIGVYVVRRLKLPIYNGL